MNAVPPGLAFHPRCLRFEASCRNCGGRLEPLSEGSTNGVTSYLPVQCVAHGCRRSYVVKAVMLACEDAVGGGHKK